MRQERRATSLQPVVRQLNVRTLRLVCRSLSKTTIWLGLLNGQATAEPRMGTETSEAPPVPVLPLMEVPFKFTPTGSGTRPLKCKSTVPLQL